MKNSLIEILNPFIRYANHLVNCTNENHSLPWRHIFDCELIYVTDGKIIVETKTKKYCVEKNQLHVMPPFVEHTRYFEDDTPCSYFSIHLDFFHQVGMPDFSANEAYVHKNAEYIERLKLKKRSDFAGLQFRDLIAVKNNEKMYSLFSDILANDKLSSTNIHALLKLKALSYELISNIVHECEAQNITFMAYRSTVYHDAITDFISYVKQNYMEKISIKEMAQKYGMSVNNFNTIFKQNQNCSPYTFVTLTRLENSKLLLISGKHDVKTVAYLVGYDNEHYFSRLFSKYEKCSPSQYAKTFNQ